MKKSLADQPSGCQPLRSKRIILKFPKKSNLNYPNNKHEEGQIQKTIILHSNNKLEGFENSNGSCWSRGPLLGKGGFGSVFLAQINKHFSLDSHSEQLFPDAVIAVKSSFLTNSCSLPFEKKVLDNLKFCPNVVQCYGDEITKSVTGRLVYNLLLEYCCGGSLYDRIVKFKPNKGLGKGLPELEVRRYTRDIVHGIASIHGRGYIHCDIKLENILLSSRVDDYGGCLTAKIADFGLVKRMSKVVTIDDDDIRGTKSYMAPESLRDSYIDWPVDIWALGCVVLEMLTGKRVWNLKVFDLDLFTKTSKNLSPLAIDFLRRCLEKNPYKRWSAWLLLGHPFVCDFNEHFESNVN